MPISPRDWNRMMDQCRIELTGSSDTGIMAKAYEVIKEFLEDSSAWREYIQLPVQVGLQNYTITPSEGQITSLGFIVDGNLLPVQAIMPVPGELHFRHAPQVSTLAALLPQANPETPPDMQSATQAANPYLVMVLKNITDPVTRDGAPITPAWLFPLYSRYILDGVLGNLMNEPGKPYTNGQKSEYHLRRFRTGIQQAKTAANRQNIAGGQPWMFPGGWQSTTQRYGVGVFPGRRF